MPNFDCLCQMQGLNKNHNIWKSFLKLMRKHASKKPTRNGESIVEFLLNVTIFIGENSHGYQTLYFRETLGFRVNIWWQDDEAGSSLIKICSFTKGMNRRERESSVSLQAVYKSQGYCHPEHSHPVSPKDPLGLRSALPDLSLRAGRGSRPIMAWA
ncbi:hypothetical protein M0804_011856 [Polistes exclamans]|nr:hypothetical protein M0804_011856 [Polistes exclamans]